MAEGERKMTVIRRIAIVGAGAMGAAYAAMFTDAGGFDVSLVARGERYERLKQEGLNVNGKHYDLAVVHPDRVGQPADLILVALKHHHLAGVLPDLQTLAGNDTTILSVMNGLESEEIIGAVAGMEKLVYAVAVGIDAVREKGCITYASPGRIIFGVTNPAAGRNVVRLSEAMDRAGIPYQVPEDIRRSLWWKFMVNVGINQASAVLGADYGVFQNSPDAMALMRMLMQEVIALAPKAGIALSQNDLEEWCLVLAGLEPGGKTSMLQDIEAGRKTEVEIFAGKVVALGERYGLPTPVNAAVNHILKVMESKSRH
jgi:2-dehydropantoate 2-reductase